MQIPQLIEGDLVEVFQNQAQRLDHGSVAVKQQQPREETKKDTFEISANHYAGSTGAAQNQGIITSIFGGGSPSPPLPIKSSSQTHSISSEELHGQRNWF